MKTLSTLLLALVGSAALAAPPVSGPQAGEKVPGPFKPLNVTGSEAGQKSCLYCRNGANPVAAVFVREFTPAVVTLIKKLDAATAANAGAQMGSFVVVLGDSPTLPQGLKQFADREGLTQTILATDTAAPPSYHVAADAAVTVLLYSHRVVRANHSFRTGELTEEGVNAALADLPKILAGE
jgi:hypothetical protein